MWSYRQLYLPNVEENATAEEYKKYRNESERAWASLEAMFTHRKEFNKEFLTDDTEDAQEKITQRLLEWVEDLQWPDGGQDGVWKSTAQTAKECCEKTSIFMQDRFWPLTKIVR